MGFRTRRVMLAIPDAPFPLDIRQNVSVAMVGVNYRFNFVQPIVAKY